MSFVDEIAVDHFRMEREMGETQDDGFWSFTWSGNSYPCTFTATNLREEIGAGGLSEIAALTLRVRLKSIATEDSAVWDWTSSGGPQAEDTVVFGGRTYRVENQMDILGQLRVLVCVDKEQ